MRPYGGPSQKHKDRYAQKNAWISAATCRIVDRRVSARWEPARYQALILRLGRAINAILKGDWRQSTEEASEEFERLLGTDPPLYQEAWNKMKGWYWAAVDRVSPPSRVTLKRITADQVELYNYVLTLGANITISVEPLPVDDSVPTEDRIKWVVKQLQNQCSGGTSGMQDEHLKRWL